MPLSDEMIQQHIAAAAPVSPNAKYAEQAPLWVEWYRATYPGEELTWAFVRWMDGMAARYQAFDRRIPDRLTEGGKPWEDG